MSIRATESGLSSRRQRRISVQTKGSMPRRLAAVSASVSASSSNLVLKRSFHICLTNRRCAFEREMSVNVTKVAIVSYADARKRSCLTLQRIVAYFCSLHEIRHLVCPIHISSYVNPTVYRARKSVSQKLTAQGQRITQRTIILPYRSFRTGLPDQRQRRRSIRRS